MTKHRITYTTPKGENKNNILIEADTREEAENEFMRDWPKMKLTPCDQLTVESNIICH